MRIAALRRDPHRELKVEIGRLSGTHGQADDDPEKHADAEGRRDRLRGVIANQIARGVDPLTELAGHPVVSFAHIVRGVAGVLTS